MVEKDSSTPYTDRLAKRREAAEAVAHAAVARLHANAEVSINEVVGEIVNRQDLNLREKIWAVRRLEGLVEGFQSRSVLAEIVKHRLRPEHQMDSMERLDNALFGSQETLPAIHIPPQVLGVEEIPVPENGEHE